MILSPDASKSIVHPFESVIFIVEPVILEPVIVPVNFPFVHSIEPSESTLNLLFTVTIPSSAILFAAILIFQHFDL